MGNADKENNDGATLIPLLHRLMGYLQESLGRLILIGVGVMHILRATNIYPSNIVSKYFILIMIPMFIVSNACVMFYTQENYKKYGGERMGTGLNVPNPDPYFYSMMVSDIGWKRKLAGYVYAASKIISVAGLAAIFYLGVREIFNK